MTDERIGIIGGTGKLGNALAGRWARAGLAVFIGSRDAAKAGASAKAIGHGARGGDNRAAASFATIVVLTVPFAHQRASLAEIAVDVAGKIVVDTTVPLVPPKVMRAQMPPEGNAARIARTTLGDSVGVVSAFHNVAAHKLADPAWRGEGDVLVFGEVREQRQRVVDLVKAAGMRGLHAGSLDNATAAEALTSVLIFMNKFYEVDGAGIRITGDLVGV
jgi:8-hydroxy-5-deazaflavin:NADPH oxidoreductase